MQNRILAVIAVTSVAALLPVSDMAGAGDTANPNLAEPVIPPLIIIAPTEVRTDPTLAKGCWVRLSPQTNFKGVDDLTIAGPIALT